MARTIARIRCGFKNGDFENAPVGSTPTTTTARWIDGTAGGSTTDSSYRWVVNLSGSASALFDSTTFYTGLYSLKLSTIGTGAFSKADIFIGTETVANISKYCIPAKANTAYTLTYRMKINYVSGDATNGAALGITQYNSSGGSLGTSLGTYIKTTTDWTQYTISFTSNAAVVWFDINPRVYGHQGTATLIMDAWFDDIVLKQTTRTTASTRTVATARSAVA